VSRNGVSVRGAVVDVVDRVGVQVISVSQPEWIRPFTGVSPVQFRRIVRVVARRGGAMIADGRQCRPWSLGLADRVLLVATYWRTNLTMRQIGPLFGVSHSAAHRIIDSLRPLLALQPARRHTADQVAIVDGTLVPTRDHRLAAPSKNYRYSTNMQVAIDADSRLVIATAGPAPGNRNDCTVYRDSGMRDQLAGQAVMADGGYRGNPGVIMPYRKRRDAALPSWQDELNTTHRQIRARIEHTLAGLKCWKILRDYRRAASTLKDTTSAIAFLHNITVTG
jgi:hypothetical protein